MRTKKNIVKIVITGGPCAGKSTALESISQALKQKLRKTFIAQEMATKLFSSGAELGEQGIPLFLFQEEVLLGQIREEDLMQRLAKHHHHKNVVIICDRGAMDSKAYLPEYEFRKLLERNQLTEEQLLKRYDMVIHMITAANGAESAYTLDNNITRKETPEEASKCDDQIMEAWKNHSNRKIIDNSTPFTQKIARVIHEILIFLETEKKTS